jgi:hypothetical protein
MSRSAIVLAAAMCGSLVLVQVPAQAQTSPSGINSSSPGSAPLTGPSVSPGTVPSQPAPFNSGTGASSGALGGALSNTPAPSLGVPSQPVPFNSPTGTVQDNATQMEMARCNSMAGGARELCVDDLRSRLNSSTGARSSPGGLSSPGAGSTTGAGSNAGSGTAPRTLPQSTMPPNSAVMPGRPN